MAARHHSSQQTHPLLTAAEKTRHILLALDTATYKIIYYYEPFSEGYVLEKCNIELKDFSGKDPSRWSIGLKGQ